MTKYLFRKKNWSAKNFKKSERKSETQKEYQVTHKWMKFAVYKTQVMNVYRQQQEGLLISMDESSLQIETQTVQKLSNINKKTQTGSHDPFLFSVFIQAKSHLLQVTCKQGRSCKFILSFL